MYGYPFVKHLAFLTLALTVPESLSKVTTLYFQKDVIRADRSSPAFSAIEDAMTLKDIQFDLNKNKNSQKKKDEKISLGGMKISKEEVISHKQKIAAKNEPVEEVSLLGEKIEVVHFTNKFVKPKTIDRSNERMLAEATPSSQKTDLSLPDFKTDWSKTKNRNVIKAPNPASSQKVLPSGIVVSLPEGEKQDSQKMLATVDSSDIVSRSGVFVSETPSFEKNMVSTESEGANNKTENEKYKSLIHKTRKPVKLAGAIDLIGGAYSRAQNFTYFIERHYDGQSYESVTVPGDKSDYSLDLLESKGYISIELRAPEGEVLAYGEKDLAEQEKGKLALKVEPTEGLFAGRALSEQESKQGQEKGLQLAKTYIGGVEGHLSADEEGFFGEENLFNVKSHFISATTKKNYWPIITLSESGKAFYPRLVKNSFVKDLSQYVDPYQEDVEINSLILGSITHMGLSQSDMKVEIYGQNYQKPVYFSKSGRPNTSIQNTTEDGRFLFVNLPDGGYLIQVRNKQDKLISQKWFIVKSGHISKGQIDLKKQSTRLAKFKGFPQTESSEERWIEVQEVGTESSQTLTRDKAESSGLEIESKTEPALTAVKVQPTKSGSKYEQLHMVPSKAQDYTLSLIDESWFNKFLNFNRSNHNRSLGLVVGFIESEEFEFISETSEILTEQSEVFYFDSKGQRVDKGVQGGGFVITNTKLGFHNLIIKLKEEETFLNKIMLTSSGSISVF